MFKKTMLIIGVAALLATSSQASTTYTTNSDGTIMVTAPYSPPVTGGWTQVGQTILADLKNATNYAIAPYMSYGLDNHKVGGGVLALYNFNNYIGGGVGVDYLGSFSLLSANVELKLPIKPLAFTGWTWATNLTATPFVYTGLGTPFSGTSGSGISTHIGVGDYITFGHLWGGRFEVGAAYITRSGAGAYSGKYLNGFFSWSHGI